MQPIQSLYLPPIKWLGYYTVQRKYEILLFSFILLRFGDSFNHSLILMMSNIFQNMFTGAFIFYRQKRLRFFIYALIASSIILTAFAPELTFINIKSWQGIIYLIYFGLVSREVFKEVLYAKTVTRELLAAALCGFVLLGMIGTFVFYQIHVKSPISFSNIGEDKDALKNLNYFSFTTLLTIGFGDILPLSLLARRAVMLMGLAGHFYTVFVTSIIIGKYISAKGPGPRT